MSMMATKQTVLVMALASCLLALAAQSVAGQAVARASAGNADGAVVRACHAKTSL
jgi:hypothetical protein